MCTMHDETELPEHVRRNRVHWDARAAEYVGPGERAWARPEPTWGIWRVPESELRVLPEDLAGKDAIELGCGTAYVSAWLARRGARVVGIDNSASQLETARRLQREHEIEDLIEVQAPEGATTRFPYHSPEWARQWPSEEVWKARLDRDGPRRRA